MWYFYRFRLNDNFGSTKWWIDLFIIDQIIRKVIESTNPNFGINLWRFHRRAGKDMAGHQLSFLCYIYKNSNKIDGFIKNTKAFKVLSGNNILKEYYIEKGGKDIDGSGDRHWPEEIGKTWPYFIHGASRSIMEMLKLMTMDFQIDIDSKNILDIEEFYIKIKERLDYIWYCHGGGAFLHHLNALFGYENIKTRQTIITSF